MEKKARSTRGGSEVYNADRKSTEISKTADRKTAAAATTKGKEKVEAKPRKNAKAEGDKLAEAKKGKEKVEAKPRKNAKGEADKLADAKKKLYEELFGPTSSSSSESEFRFKRRGRRNRQVIFEEEDSFEGHKSESELKFKGRGMKEEQSFKGHNMDVGELIRELGRGWRGKKF